MALELVADSDERVTFVGQTGMGKTFLVERLAKGQPRFLVVDSKHRVQWKGFHMTDNPVAALMEDKCVYRPPTGRPPEGWFREAMQSLHERGGGVIYCDELSVVCSDTRIPADLADVYRLGRELGVGVWGSAQEATGIHNTTLRQAGMIVLFYNQGASDRDKLTRIVGDMGETTGRLPKYEFVVFVRGETYDDQNITVYKVIP